MSRRATIVAAILVALAGCATSKLGKVNAIPVSRIDDVVAEVKRQISIYHSRVNDMKRDPSRDAALADARRRGFVCGRGKIDFDLWSVTMTLTTTVTSTASASIAVAAPIVPAGTFGLSAGGSHAVDNTQELTIPLFTPLPGPGFTYSRADERAPIAETLLNLREALIKGATAEGSCLVTYNFRAKKDDKGGTYKIAITVTDTGKGGVSIKLAPYDVSAGAEGKAVTGNSLTVNFKQAGVFDEPELDPRGEGVGIATPQ